MSLLTMVQNVCKECGMDSPSTVLANTNKQVVQLLRLVYKTGADLRARVNWPELLKEATITLVSGTSAYSYPADFDRIIAETAWNSSLSWPLLGPMTPQEYEARLRGTLSLTAFQHFIAKGSGLTSFVVYPTPGADDAGDLIYFLYQSSYWTDSAGTAAAAFAADTATSLIDEDLVELGVKWRFKRENGMSYELDAKEYEDRISSRATAKKSAKTLSLVGRRRSRFISMANCPEGDFG